MDVSFGDANLLQFLLLLKLICAASTWQLSILDLCAKPEQSRVVLLIFPMAFIEFFHVPHYSVVRQGDESQLMLPAHLDCEN